MGKKLMLSEALEAQNYHLLEKIGEGSFGEIFTARNIKNQTIEVLKVINFKSKTKSTYKKELGMSKRLKKFPNYFVTPQHHFTVHFDSKHFGVFSMPKFDIDLMDFVLKYKYLSEDLAKKVFHKICLGVSQLHHQKIFHLDIKPDNILLMLKKSSQNLLDYFVVEDDEEDNSEHSSSSSPVLNTPKMEDIEEVKICDFGSVSTKSLLRPGRKVGTHEYLPPEVIFNNPLIISSKVDIWSLGVTLFVMLTGLFPVIYSGSQMMISDLSIINTYCGSTDCINLLSWIFTNNPQDRPTIDDILQHPFFY